MEGQSGLLELSVISWVSSVEGCSFHCTTLASRQVSLNDGEGGDGC